MPIWSPNSKKCSAAELALAGAAALALLQAHPATAAASSPSGRAPAVLARPSADELIYSSLRADIAGRSSSTFDHLIKRWEQRYGTRAVVPLLRIASNSDSMDADRYIALMAAAKLGGPETAPALTVYLRDRAWMVRSGALRALTALRNPAAADAVLPLLEDPALVVRMDAVDAVRELHPRGAAQALLATLEHSSNYHGGKAQWVPQRALAALATLHAQEIAPRLRPLLDHQEDPELQSQTVATLESLTGKALKRGAPLPERVREWKLALQTVRR